MQREIQAIPRALPDFRTHAFSIIRALLALHRPFSRHCLLTRECLLGEYLGCLTESTEILSYSPAEPGRFIQSVVA